MNDFVHEYFSMDRLKKIHFQSNNIKAYMATVISGVTG
jgi:hypothetical protein